MRHLLHLRVVLICLWAFAPVHSHASEDPSNPAFSSSGLSIPRFVSLSNGETNVRVGPGQEYPIKSVYKRAGLPVEVVLEYDNWRKIRDHEGDEGWVYHTLLSGKRYGLIQSDKTIYAYETPFDGATESRAVLELEPMVQVFINECSAAWCYVNVSGFSGWIKRKFIWGVYEHENFD